LPHIWIRDMKGERERERESFSDEAAIELKKNNSFSCLNLDTLNYCLLELYLSSVLLKPAQQLFKTSHLDSQTKLPKL